MKHVMQDLGELAGLDVVRARAPILAGEARAEPAQPHADYRLAGALTGLRAWLFGPQVPSLARNGRCQETVGREPAGTCGQAAPSPLAER